MARLHLRAYSRGAANVASAPAELSAEAYMLQSSPTREFHIGNVVLVAPDVDADVALSKIFVASALSSGVTSGRLFGSIAGLGRIDPTMFCREQFEAIGRLRAIDIIEVRRATDFFGHSHFIFNRGSARTSSRCYDVACGPMSLADPLSTSRGPSGRCARHDRPSHRIDS